MFVSLNIVPYSQLTVDHFLDVISTLSLYTKMLDTFLARALVIRGLERMNGTILGPRQLRREGGVLNGSPDLEFRPHHIPLCVPLF